MAPERQPQNPEGHLSFGGFNIRRSKLLFLCISLISVFVLVAVVTWQVTKQQDSESQKNITKETVVFSEKLSHLLQPPERHKPVDIRLPRSVVPIAYKLEIIPYLEPKRNFSFSGKVWIDLKCIDETNEIVLHKKALTVDDANIQVTKIETADPLVNEMDKNENMVMIVETTYDERKKFFTIEVNPPLETNTSYRVYLEYSGKLEKGIGGFSWMSYMDKISNLTKYVALTKFKPTGARKAFPCFDEPDFKANFTISIARKKTMVSISNTNLVKSEPVLNHTDLDGWMWDHFKESMPMPTYSIYFAITDLDNKTADRSGSTPEFKIWCRQEVIHSAEYAKDIGPKLVNIFEDHFNIELPISKLDLVGIPDLCPGTNENWGGTVYRESLLLIDNLTASEEDKMAVAQVISREISQKWFGNLITPMWWNDAWLNEGFLIYLEYIGANYTNPKSKPLEQFVTSILQKALRKDSVESAQAISKFVSNPTDLERNFEFSTFEKSAALLRMLNHVVTENVFKIGLHNFVKDWGYKSISPNDLWLSLNDQAHIFETLPFNYSVETIMNSWTNLPGYPLITVITNYTTGNVTISQSKFPILCNPNKTEEYSSYRWWVPINFASDSINAKFEVTAPFFWLTENQSKFTLTNITLNQSSWLIVNVQQTGFFRVTYDIQNWARITQQLWRNHSRIHVVNRAQLVDDAYAIAKAELLPYEVVLNMSVYLRKETKYLPWQAFSQAIEYLVHMLCRSPVYGMLQDWLKDLIEKQYNRLGFVENSTDAESTRQLRVVLVKLACRIEQKDSVDRSAQEYASWMKKTDPDRVNPISPYLRETVYCTSLKQGGTKELEFLFTRYQNSEVATQKAVMLSALGCSKEIGLLNRLLNWTLTEESGIKKMDVPILFRSMFMQDVGSSVAFKFVQERWRDILKFFGLHNPRISLLLDEISRRLNTQSELDALEHFKSQYHNQLGAAEGVINQAIENARANIRWLGAHESIIKTWLPINDEPNDTYN